jgi:hypothetical protein
VDDPTTTEAEPADRRQRFEADLAEIKVRTGTNASEGRLVAIGVAMMAIGLVIAIASFVASGGQADTRDVLSSVIMAIVGLSVSVVGAVLFLRYSFARFLRVWMLRLLYEQSADR